MSLRSNDLFDFGVPYIKEKLEKEEEYELVRRYQKHKDELAFQKLLGAHAMAIRASVRKFTRGDVDIEELYSQGMIGFMKGVQGFKPSKGVRLYTYAKYWIDAKIRRALEKHIKESNNIKSLDAMAENFADGDGNEYDTYSSLTTNLLERYGHEPTMIKFVEELPFKLDNVCVDVIKDIAKSVVTYHTKKDFINRHVDILNTRLLNTDNPATLDSISVKYGVTRENVRQSEIRLLNSLKKYLPYHIEKSIPSSSNRAIPIMEDLFGDYMECA